MTILVAGLPGSGKTHWLQAEASRTGALLFDDFKAHAHKDDWHFKCARRLPELMKAIAAGRRCVIADIDFCRTEARTDAECYLMSGLPGAQRLWIFFGNDPERCRVNVLADESRGAQNRLREIARLAPAYEIPGGAVVLPVWASALDVGGCRVVRNIHGRSDG